MLYWANQPCSNIIYLCGDIKFEELVNWFHECWIFTLIIWYWKTYWSSRKSFIYCHWIPYIPMQPNIWVFIKKIISNNGILATSIYFMILPFCVAEYIWSRFLPSFESITSKAFVLHCVTPSTSITWSPIKNNWNILLVCFQQTFIVIVIPYTKFYRFWCRIFTFV